jgi:signal transduction histidine kinase
LDPEARVDADVRAGISLFLALLVAVLVLFTPITFSLAPDLVLPNGVARLCALGALVGGWVWNRGSSRPVSVAVAVASTLVMCAVILFEIHLSGQANHPFLLAPAFLVLALALFIPMGARWFVGAGLFVAVAPLPLIWTGAITADPAQQGLYVLITGTIALVGAVGVRRRRLTLVLQYTAEWRLRARTQELQIALDELSHTQHQLLTANRMATIGRLASGIVSGVARPLSELSIAVDELPRVAAVERAEHALSHIQAYVGDLARSTQHLAAGEAVAFDVLNEVQVVVNLLGYRTLDPEVDVRVLGTHGIVVQGDPGQFQQVITNVLSNALDATEEAAPGQGIEVLIALVELGVEIRVIDHGLGVDQSISDVMFEPMVSTKMGIGLGLGLSVTRDLVVGAFGGSIRCEETPGGGATFVVVLPPVASGLPAPM